MWFTIKSKSFIIVNQIQIIKFFPKKVNKIVMIVMENINGSAYHLSAHHEKPLLSMLADDNMEVRVKAVEIIIKGLKVGVADSQCM